MLLQKLYVSPEKQRRGPAVLEGKAVGKGYCKQSVHWRNLGVESVMAFHWLTCDNLSLAGLSPSKKKTFLSPIG